MLKERLRKIYYKPGIISLLILPFVFIYFANNEIKRKTSFVLPLVMADTNYLKTIKAFQVHYNSFPPKRNYVDIRFTGDNNADQTKIAFAQIKIREIIEEKDYNNGIHFKFTDNCTYGTFVNTINILKKDSAKTYMALEKDIWFYQLQPFTTYKNFMQNCVIYNDVYFVTPEVSLREKILKALRHIWETSWSVIILFLAFLSLVLLINRNKRNHKRTAAC